MNKVGTLVVDRARCGINTQDRHEGGKLYSSQTRRMCCLGFLSRACGHRVSDILDFEMPEETVHWRVFRSFCSMMDPAKEAAVINDNADLSVWEKEERLKRLWGRSYRAVILMVPHHE